MPLGIQLLTPYPPTLVHLGGQTKMKHDRLRPKQKINELLLLVTIYSYTKGCEYGEQPTAEILMGFKSEFAPSLQRIDTLRTWLYRHNGRIIRRINDRRLYRYELNRQGKKRIVLLAERALRNAILEKQLGLPVKRNMRELYFIARELAETVEKRMFLLDLIVRFLRI